MANDTTTTADHIAELITPENVAEYAETSEKFLFIDGLLMDAGIPRLDVFREFLEDKLEAASAPALTENEVIAAKAIAEILAPGWGEAETPEPKWGLAYHTAAEAVKAMR